MDKTNPKHYRDAAITLEPIDLCELLGFNLGNAVKYIVRAGRTRQPYEGDRQAPAASSTTRQLGNHHEQHRNAPRRTTSQDEPAL